MVPEDNNQPQQDSKPEDEKVQVDDQEVSESSVRSNQKVELDLDDAPFLEWDEEEEEKESTEKKKELSESGGEDEAKEQEGKESILLRLKRKWWMFAAAAALLLISAVLAIFLVPLQEEQKELPREAEQKSEASGKNASEKGRLVSLKPFWVEYGTENDYQHFHLGIDLSVNGSKPAWELEKKTPVIRDSLYHFLKNKDINELADKNNIRDLKKEILTIVNNNLSNGKADQVLIQKYLVE